MLTQHLVGAAEVFYLTHYPDKAQRVLRAAEKCAPSAALQAHIAALRRGAPDTNDTLALPAETYLRIFAQLDLDSLHSAAAVCRQWRGWICAHSALWHSIAVGRPAPSSVPPKVRLQRQSALLGLYVRRAKRHLQRVTLAAPLADADTALRLLHDAPLKELTVHCAYEKAGAWIAFGLACPALASLAVHAGGAQTHPWLGRPLDMRGAQCALTRLALHGTPPLASDAATLRVCAHLTHLAYSAPACAAPLRTVRERSAAAVQTIVHAAQSTLEELCLDGDAIWAIDAFADAPQLPQAGIARFPRLHTLQAPLKCMVLHSLPEVALGSLMPQLSSLALQVSLPRTPGGTSAALLQFACATRASLKHVALRITRDSATWLVECLLRVWVHLESVSVTWDEAVHTDSALLESAEETLQRPLTGALLVQLLTPGALHGREHVLCPALHTLTVGSEATLRGRELAELVGMRTLLAQKCSVRAARHALFAQKSLVGEPDLDTAPARKLDTLDVRGCRELQPDTLPFLRQHCTVHWSAHEAERARHATRAPRTARDRLASYR